MPWMCPIVPKLGCGQNPLIGQFDPIVSSLNCKRWKDVCVCVCIIYLLFRNEFFIFTDCLLMHIVELYW